MGVGAALALQQSVAAVVSRTNSRHATVSSLTGGPHGGDTTITLVSTAAGRSVTSPAAASLRGTANFRTTSADNDRDHADTSAAEAEAAATSAGAIETCADALTAEFAGLPPRAFFRASADSVLLEGAFGRSRRRATTSALSTALRLPPGTAGGRDSQLREAAAARAWSTGRRATLPSGLAAAAPNTARQMAIWAAQLPSVKPAGGSSQRAVT